MPLEPLSADLLYRDCDVSQFEFSTTAELSDAMGLVGQDRALEAIRFGTRMDKSGYNIFALGPHGAGMRDGVIRHLQSIVGKRPVPGDWVYVNNFTDPNKPVALRTTAGRAEALRSGVADLIQDLRGSIPAILESEEYKKRLAAIDANYTQHQGQAFEALRIKAEAKNVTLLSTPSGFAFAPQREGEVMKPETFNELPEEEREKIKDTIGELEQELASIFQHVPGWEKERRAQVHELNREVATNAVGRSIHDLTSMFEGNEKVAAWLRELEADLVENIGLFTAEEREQLAAPMGPIGGDVFRRYTVNVIVNNGPDAAPEPTAGNSNGGFIGGGAPIITEEHPAFANLIGRVEHMSNMGALVTDFSLIKAGSLHRANGGYLLIDALRLLREPLAWDGLKRALRTQRIVLEAPGDYLSLVSTVALEPDPIPLETKVILFGDRLLYYMLAENDPEFRDLFKVSADFDDQIDRDGDTDLLYAEMIATLCRENDLLPLTAAAVGRVIEESSRFAEDAEKLSLEVGSITDLMQEADLYARDDAADAIDVLHVQQAIDERVHRADRLRERSLEAITRDVVMIDTEGFVAGQVNGLSVLSLGQASFGRPTRITARARMGKGNVVDIEREVDLGGALHSKGVLILTGFLSAHFAINIPLSLTATLVFEQSYGGVDGDSASVAELVALLSSLAEVPVNQGLAVTGSLNQLGQIQPIGGVNEKIEGFFDICMRRGLTGDQGVIIPAANVKHLMLRRDVVDAVERGMFSVFAAETIEDAVTIMTGAHAGQRDENDDFPPGSLFERVDQRLLEFAEAQVAFGKDDSGVTAS
ncbi:MAG: AAA family ATPase [Rhodobiaceae bacterium]|nr:DNA-binding ATP-dependent protease La [Rhodobiaceae bacterium]MCR9240139.1 AAA family ATPase [Rhodobiaceae bacterium]